MKSKKTLVLLIVFLLIGSTMLARVQHAGLSTKIGIQSSASSTELPGKASGPLRVHSSNHRYFTDNTGKAIYLGGFQFWDSWLWSNPEKEAHMTFEDFLKTIKPFGGNFIRLWLYTEFSHYWMDKYTIECTSRLPWQRTGPGNAHDGLPKFNLTLFNKFYFDELRTRVVAARDAGYYVAVMLFEGGLGGGSTDWLEHPFAKGNNVNGISATGSTAHTLQIPAVTAIQNAYIEKVIDTLNDLDNYFYEVSNEDLANIDGSNWQEHVIDKIKTYERRKPKQHPVWRSATYSPSSWDDSVLFASSADAIAPGRYRDYKIDPPVADGSKVIIIDSDHLWGATGSKSWIWKSFAAGLNVSSYMEFADLTSSNPLHVESRKAVGHTVTYANKIDLASMTPRGDLTSTGYALANPSSEYLIYLPSSGHPGIRWLDRLGLHPWVNWFTYLIGWNQTVKVDVSGSSETFRVEWFNPRTGETVDGATTSGGGKRSFTCPFTGDALLHIYKP